MAGYEKILVPLDGSGLAEQALPPALALAEALSAGLVLLRVVTPVLSAIDPNFYEEISRLGQDEAQSYLHALKSDLTAPVTVETQIVRGEAAESIIDYAGQHDVDLIVMSSHGRSGLGRWVYGSVAEKVLHQAPGAALIIRAQTEVKPFQYKRLLVPLDGSTLAEQALSPALAIAKAVSAELALLRVTTPAYLAIEALAMNYNPADIEAQDRKEANEYLQGIVNSLAEEQVPVQAHEMTGPIAETIVDFADKNQIDLIVMSSHGRSGVGRWFYGSIAEKVLRGANCATLIVRQQ